MQQVLNSVYSMGSKCVFRLMKQRGHIDRSEGARLAHMLKMERELNGNGFTRIAGVDEAGRGPLAGPVCAAAVIFEPGVRIAGVNDSKQVQPEFREVLYDEIMTKALSVGVGLADADEIDSINILNATKLASERALRNLNCTPDFILFDALKLPNIPIPQKGIIKGDTKCFSIAAGSIIAKVTRDRLMVRYAEAYPNYAFEQHKGYCTKLHWERIVKYGVSSIHRRSFFDPGFFGGEEVTSLPFKELAIRLGGRFESGILQNSLTDILSLRDFLPKSEIARLMEMAKRLSDSGPRA